MSGCILGCQYIPSVEYFAHWMYHGSILIESHEHYPKRTWRNKTAIQGQSGPLFLSVPLRKGKHNQLPIKEVEISYDETWNRIHYQSIISAYGKTAFFSEMQSEFKDILYRDYQNLWDLNLTFIQYIIELIPGSWRFEFTGQYEQIQPEGIIDLRQGVPAGFSRIDVNKVLQYDQVHRLDKSHLPNLSILDVLCHLGPGTRDYLISYSDQLYK